MQYKDLDFICRQIQPSFSLDKKSRFFLPFILTIKTYESIKDWGEVDYMIPRMKVKKMGIQLSQDHVIIKRNKQDLQEVNGKRSEPTHCTFQFGFKLWRGDHHYR